jgi:hypothetical protein
MKGAIIAAVVIILLIGGASAYFYFNKNSSGTNSVLGFLHPVNLTTIPEIQSNPTSYLNRTIDVRATLEETFGTSIVGLYYLQNGVSSELYQYVSSNQTSWSLAATLPNQPNRNWQYGSSYLFVGHLSILYGCGGSLAYGYQPAINGTCHNSTVYQNSDTPLPSPKYYCTSQQNSSFLGGEEYTCYKSFLAVPLYYFNVTNATLNS